MTLNSRTEAEKQKKIEMKRKQSRRRLVMAGIAIATIGGLFGLSKLLPQAEVHDVATVGPVGMVAAADSGDVEFGMPSGYRKHKDMGHGINLAVNEQTGEMMIYDTSAGAGTITTSVEGMFQYVYDDMTRVGEMASNGNNLTPAQEEWMKKLAAAGQSMACENDVDCWMELLENTEEQAGNSSFASASHHQPLLAAVLQKRGSATPQELSVAAEEGAMRYQELMDNMPNDLPSDLKSEIEKSTRRATATASNYDTLNSNARRSRSLMASQSGTSGIGMAGSDGFGSSGFSNSGGFGGSDMSVGEQMSENLRIFEGGHNGASN